MTHTVRIWDLPTRLFHWLLALCVIGLVITANVGGNAMVWHFRLGYAVATLLLFLIKASLNSITRRYCRSTVIMW